MCALADKSDKEAKDFYWKGRIKPSSISLNMCIEEYQKTCDQYKKFPIKLRMKFEFGHAIHKYIGEFFRRECPHVYDKDVESRIPEHVRSWYEKCQPEVPLDSPDFLVRCIMDFPAKIQGESLVMDWKTTWQEPKTWEEFCIKPRIKDEYLAQLASYVYLYTECGYYDKYPSKFGLTFINMKMDMEKQEAWKEVYYDSAPFIEPIAHLWNDLLIPATKAKLEGRFVPCTNRLCFTHGSTSNWLKIKPLDFRNLDTTTLMEETDYTNIRPHPIVDKARLKANEVRKTEDIRSHYG